MGHWERHLGIVCTLLSQGLRRPWEYMTLIRYLRDEIKERLQEDWEGKALRRLERNKEVKMEINGYESSCLCVNRLLLHLSN